MDEQIPTVTTIADLIGGGRPLTAASSLVPSRPISVLKPHNTNPDRHHRRHKPPLPTDRNPNSKTLKPLNQPTLLLGNLILPSFSDSPINCSCFRFCDDSATICCHVLDFDPRMIGVRVRVLAWNFIPVKCGDRGVKGGILEIISWDFDQDCCLRVCSLLDFSSFCLSLLGNCDVKDGSDNDVFVFGVMESISPVFVVSCASGDSSSRNISGFLVNVLVCQCKSCVSKFGVSGLRDLREEGHCFVKTVIVYFCKVASSWHPVMLRFVGRVVLFTGLKKRLVFLRKEESQLMYVTTDEASFHIPKLFNKRGLIRNKEIRGKGEFGSYTGVITGVYMKGMVVELDQDVILLLTDQHIAVPHCFRVGAIVTLKNVHFVDPKFQWGKMLILGACCRSSVYVESFSPLETGCHIKSYFQSLLQKFIDSLPFAARLWALLVVSCFRKKFAGVLSEKEIMGSKHNEGLAQKYASSYFASSDFQCQHGVMLEFCKHDLCCGAMEAHYGHLRLVAPIANLISYCEDSWKKILDNKANFWDIVGCTTPKKPLLCGGRSFEQSFKRVLRTEEIGVIVLGNLKISLSSGRLQLVDATGGVDIMLDLPATWDFDRIFEAKDFSIIMEGMPPKLVNLDSTIYQPLSCRNIFNNAQPLRRTKTSVYLYHCKTDEDSRSRSLFFDGKKNSQLLDSGQYHLLVLTHKFPIQQKFQGDLATRSNIFAEAIVMHWDLLVSGKYGDSIPEKHLTHKKCKIEQSSVEASNYGLYDAVNGLSGQFNGSCSSYSNSYREHTWVSNHPLELPCLIACKGVNYNCAGMLRCTNAHAKLVCGCKLARRILLEFGPDSFCKYEALKIGHCYLVKHQEKDMLCSIKENYQVSRSKVNITSATHLRRFTFSSIESPKSDVSDVFPFWNLHIGNDEVISQGNQQLEIRCLTENGADSEIYSDITLFVPLGALNLLESVTKIRDANPFEEEPDINDRVGSTIDASMHSSGSSSSDYSLLEGNLVTIRGLIVALHDSKDDAFRAQPRSIPGEGYLPLFLQGNGGVCIHVMVDSQMVRIFCDLTKQTYPVGLGRAAHATFHRILKLRQNKYMMTPVSFITIVDMSLMNGHLRDENNYAYRPLGSNSVPTPNSTPITLIFDALQLSEPKPIQFRCRLVAVYVLVLEKARTTAIFQSSEPSTASSIGIPFAGFVMDDGSSSCCCWVDSEKAAALLGLEFEEFLLKYSSETYGKSKAGIGQPYSSTISHLSRILEHNGRVVMKNYGSVFDSSCQDLVLSVDSDRLLSNSDEDILRSLITDAIFSISWTINGSLMDQKALSWLEESLTELNMSVPPLLNVWMTSVCCTDMLAEARNIIQELM